MSKMSIGSITSTRQADRPVRLVVYGVSGVGKTTFAADAPKPVFLCAEDGAGFLDARAFPRPTAWADVFEAIRVLTQDEHPFETFIVDTLDALEPLCFEHVCKVHNKKHIEEFGYGKGWLLAQDEWVKLLRALEELQARRKMHVILLAHAVTKEHNDPDRDASWKRWILKMKDKLAEKTVEWTDALLFTSHEALARKEGLKVRGVSTGERLLHTTWAASHDGKNRLGLPPVLPLDWAAFWEAALPALRPGPVGPTEAELRECDQLVSSLDVLIPQLEDPTIVKVRLVYQDTRKDDLSALRALHKRVGLTLTKESEARRAREAAPAPTTSPEADSSAA